MDRLAGQMTLNPRRELADTRWVRRVLLLMVVGLLAGGCIIEPEGGDCDCPEFEQLVASIEWVEGVLPSRVVDPGRSSDGPFPELGLRAVYEDSGAVEAERLADRLQEADLPVAVIDGAVWVEDVEYLVYFEIAREPLAVQVSLLGVPDDEAEETLRPLIEALGTHSDDS